MVTVDEAREKVAAAQATLAEATATFEEHVTRKRMAEALATSKAVIDAEAILAKANSAVMRLEYESRAEERNMASATLKAAVDSLIASESFTAAQALGVTGFTVITDSNGALAVAIRTIGEPKAPRASGGSGGGTSGRLVHVVDGAEFTSRELLNKYHEEVFGAEATVAMWERRAKGGGFDASVKSLLKKLGEAGHTVSLMKKVEGNLIAVQ